MVIIGESGVGKTRLAVEAACLADGAGAVVLSAVGLEPLTLAPFALFAEGWRDAFREHGLSKEENPFAAFRPTPGGAPQEDTLRLFMEVDGSLDALSRGRASLLIVDDLHLADESSLHLIHFLARTTRTRPRMILATCREEEMSLNARIENLLANLHREKLLDRLAVQPLDLEASRAQMRDVWRDLVEEEIVSSVYALAEGNPFYTEEVLRVVRNEGAAAIPRDVAETLRHRVRALGEDVESLLKAAAVEGGRFDFEVAREAASLPSDAALSAVEKAIAAHLVEEADVVYRFRHALLREALYGSLTTARRRDLHGRVAEALGRAGYGAREEGAATLAFHYGAAGEHARAIPYLVAAGERAAARAGLREAVTFFARALDEMSLVGMPPGPDEFQLLNAMGQMRVALSDLGPAVHDLDRAATLVRDSDGWRPGPGEHAQARRWAALGLITAGDLSAAEKRLEDALSDLGGEGTHPELPQVLYHLAQLRWHEGRHQDAYQIAERALVEAERQGARDAIARGYEMLALACHSLGAWKEGAEFEERRQGLVGTAIDVAQAFDVHL